jgi:quercetin dioxygenase-like cupin family protein
MPHPADDGTKDRRRFLEACLAGAILSLSPTGSNAAGAAETTAKEVFQHDLPDLMMSGWQVSVAEVTTPPGVVDPRHQHPGFVLGYVLEGDLRFQVAGQPETVIHTGEMFYEPPGSVHAVSASASPTKPVRFLALILAEKGKALTTPA